MGEKDGVDTKDALLAPNASDIHEIRQNIFDSVFLADPLIFAEKSSKQLAEVSASVLTELQ